MSSLSIEIFETARAVVVRLDGEAGIRAADALEAPFQRIIAVRPAVVIFDLAGLLFAASLFLGTLVNFRRGIAYQGGKVQLARTQPNIRELFQKTGLEELFEFVAAAPDRSDALPSKTP
jgi:anti-anti-sigma factor